MNTFRNEIQLGDEKVMKISNQLLVVKSRSIFNWTFIN